MPGFSYIPHFVYSQWFVTPKYPSRSFAKQTVVITGANTGLGFEAAKHVVRLGAEKVIIGVRSVDKGNAAKAEIEAATGRVGVIEVWQLDLQSYESVKMFAGKVQSDLSRLDVLLENAGISTTKFALTEGQESTITVNVISTLLLALLLLPKLRETAKMYDTTPRLTIVSSEVHYFGIVPDQKKTSKPILASLAEEKSFATGQTYWTSKLLLILALQQLVDELCGGRNEAVIINHVNPGLCASSLMQEMGFAASMVNTIFHARSTEVGSRTLVDAASAGPETHGAYLSDCKIAPVSSYVTSNEGKVAADQIWAELKDVFDGIRPGIIDAARA